MLEPNLRELTAAYGPAGREEAVRAALARLAGPLCESLTVDPLGNLIAFRPGCSGKKLMLCAHMDQIGLMVTDIDETGFLRCAAIGGLKPAYALARRVVFENGCLGTVFLEAGKNKPDELADLYIDIGATGRAEAEAKVSIGDAAVFHAPLALEGDMAVGGALDDRLGCAVLLEALEAPCPHDLYAVFSAQEEVGARGAGPAAYGIRPDLAVALDVTPAMDIPGPKAPPAPIALGRGPALKMMDGSVVVSGPVRRLLEERAAAAGVAVQYEVLKAGGTDTGALSRAGTGVPAGCVSLPCRYLHTPVETAHLGDARGAVAWIKAILGANL